MPSETFLRLQHSESTVCTMASHLLAAFINCGQLTPSTEEACLEKSADLAIRLARKIDRAVESDDEQGDR